MPETVFAALPWSQFLERMLYALIFGGLIGMERQWRERTSGLRTNALVACGSAAFALLSVVVTEKGVAHVIIAQIVTGIGFLGAGVIMNEGFSIRGLNTAATLWCSAAVGSLCGVGLAMEAGLVAAIVLLINLAMRPLGRFFHKLPLHDTDLESVYRFKVSCDLKDEALVRELLMKAVKHQNLRLQRLKTKKLKENNQCLVMADVAAVDAHADTPEAIVSKLSVEGAIWDISWEIMVGGFE